MYTLLIHSASDGYTLHVHSPYCWRWKEIPPALPYWWQWKNKTCMSILLAVEGDTPCTSILMGVKEGTPYTSILLALKMDTPCTSILLAVEGDTPCVHLYWWWWEEDTLHVHTAGGGKGYTLQAHTAVGGGGERDTSCRSWWWRDTPCTSKLQVAESDTPSIDGCWWCYS